MESMMEASMDSSTDTTMSKNEKYKLSFKQSKQKVKDWEGEFFRSNQRKPDKEEMRSAPENVQIAYKNCYKIKAYFAKAENASDTTSEVFNEDSQTLDTTVSNTKNESKHTSFSGVLSNSTSSTTSTLPSEIPCADISNLGKVWGKHLNHKPRKTSSLTSYDKMSSKLGLQLSQVTSSSTRTSLKKRKNKFQSFTDTLGDSSANDSTLENNSISTPPPPSAAFTTSTTLPPSPTRSPSPEYQLFPLLVTGKVVTGPAKVPTMVTSKLDRKVDPSWLERCAGVGGEGGDNDLVGGGGDHGANRAVKHTEPSGDGDTEREPSLMKTELRTAPELRPPELRPATEVTPASEVTPTTEVTPATEVGPVSDVTPATEMRPPSEVRPAYESQLDTEVMVRPAKRISSKTDTVKTNKKVATPVVPFEMDVDEDDETAETGGISDKIDKGLDINTKKSVGKTFEKGSNDVKEKSKNSKENKKRKRESESGEENYSGDDNDESDNNTETEMDAKPKKKTAQKAEKKAAKPRKKKVKKVESSEEEDDVPSAVVEGPSDMNLYALGFEEGDVSARQAVRKVQTAQERLASKVNSGKASDNFLKIDIKKKSYSRGKGGSSGEMIKRKEWQRKVDMKAGKKVKEFKCYRCGELGHFSRQCTGGKGDALIPSEMADEFDPGEFPTLDEARDMATGIVKKDDSKVTRLFTVKKNEEGEQDNVNLDFETVDDALLLEAAMQFECAPVEDATAKFAVPPLISSIKEDRQFVYTALARFGYEQFREGQEEAIMRILAGQSSLVLLATGTGKSLIYQLPALLYGEKSNCITLVVSPLVSLMEDQVTGLPPFLKAAALHYNMTASQKEKVVEQVKSGKLHFLLVSPEAVAGGGGAFGALLPNLPPIAFVCIDEAHCVSHWSHNFRPSYLRLSKIIREKLGVKTILGLTATAPESLTRSVAEHLGVPDDGVIRGPLLPGNLTMTVSKDAERDKALLAMLTEGTLADCDSVIIYCTRREVCERLATVVRTHLQARDIKLAERRERKTRVSATAEPYHAGLSSYRRKTVQNHFMSGKLRIVIATVAFGMGIDKSDIRAIVHYNMPRTFESYIQEIGRAGRDGKPARGHLFLDSRGGDLTELKRHIFANSMDRHTLRKLLHAVFPQSCTETDRQGGYHEVAVSVDKLVEQLDLPEENISTLLCYLENYSPPYIKLSNPVYCMAKVQCYGGPRQLRQVAAKCPPLAAAIALLRQAGQQDLQAASSVEFQVVEVSAKMGWESAIVKKELKNLEWSSTPTGWKKTGTLVEFSDLAFHFSAATGLEEGALDELLEQLYTRVTNREKTELWGLTRLNKAFTTVAYDKQVEGGGEEDKEKSDKLKVFIREYFEEPERHVPEVLAPPAPCQHEDQVRAEIRSFVCQHQEHDWSGRAVARVFHGIQSPNYPAKQWGRVFRSWRSHLDTDFNLLVQFAKEEILSLRRGAR